VYRPEKADTPILAVKIGDEDVIVLRREVMGYVSDPCFQHYLSAYQYTKLWGLPNGNGWANEPSDLLEGITALELEARLLENESYEKAHKSQSSGTGAINARKSQT